MHFFLEAAVELERRAQPDPHGDLVVGLAADDKLCRVGLGHGGHIARQAETKNYGGADHPRRADACQTGIIPRD